MVALVLAAGYATRLYPLTRNYPKALLKIGGKAIVDHICDEIGTISAISRTVVVSNEKYYGFFCEWARARARDQTGPRGLAVLSDGTGSEETRLGAIGDIRFAIEREGICDDMLIIAGDNFFTFRLRDFYSYYEAQDADCAIVKRISDREVLKGKGIAVTDPGGRILEFEEKPQSPRSDLVVYAAYIYKRDTLPLIGEYLGEGNNPDAPGYFAAWLCKRKRLMAYAFDGECYDVGTPESYAALNGQYGGGLPAGA
jgi:glucose-1-phosphate thymidylyltransferase